MGYIYKITNDINNKVYVGQTTQTLEQRFKQHQQDAFYKKYEKRPLYSAIRKYGIEHFQISLIEECLDSELSNREIYWIAYYRGYEDGYNGTHGGEGKLFYDHEKIKNKLLEHPYPIDIAKEFGCCVDIVCQIAQKNNILIKNKSNEQLAQNKKQIHQYTKDNQYIQSFESTVKAGEWCFNNGKCSALTSGVRSHIADVANGKRKSAYGYIWKYN